MLHMKSLVPSAKRRSANAVIVLALGLAGCMSSRNISKVPPFSEYVGRTLPTVRPVALIKEGRGIWGTSHFPRLRNSPYVMLDLDPANKFFTSLSWSDTNYLTFPAGAAVSITQVRDEIVADAAHLVAYGTLTLPGSTNQVRFAYSWGEYWHLRAAPWEPKETPEIRRPPGKNPPHWDYDMFYVHSNAPVWGISTDR